MPPTSHTPTAPIRPTGGRDPLESPSRARTRCTDLRGTFDAGALDVCRVGDLVALHLATAQGRFVFRLDEITFVQAVRGPRDSNGQPFRTAEEIHALDRAANDERLGPKGEIA